MSSTHELTVHCHPVPAGTRALRVFGPGKRWGDPYVWSCMVVPTAEDGVVEIALAHRAPTPDEWRPVRAKLRAHGFHAYIRRDGAGHIKERPL